MTIRRGPIFQSWGIRGILDGSKTMTRRLIKTQPAKENIIIDKELLDRTGLYMTWLKNPNGGIDEDYNPEYWKCPYQVGDILWLRETWAQVLVPDGTTARKSIIVYKVDNPQGVYVPSKWQSPLFMPEWASRIPIELTDIKPPERVQDISEEDAEKEGVNRISVYGDKWVAIPEGTYKLGFNKAWNSINAKWKPVKSKGIIIRYECYPWSEEDIPVIPERTKGIQHIAYPNPWNFVYEFKTLKEKP